MAHGQRGRSAPLGKDYLPNNLAPSLWTEYLYPEPGLTGAALPFAVNAAQRAKDLHVPDNLTPGDIWTPQSFYVPHVQSTAGESPSNQQNLGDVNLSPFANNGGMV